MVDLDQLRPAADRAAKFVGGEYEAQNSFFMVTSPPGRGVNKHRHPYEEIFVILHGDIDVTIDGETELITGKKAIVIPPQTWHEFINRGHDNALMVTIHNSPAIIQEDWPEAAAS